MRATVLLSSLLAGAALAAPAYGLSKRASVPTVYLIGDSTMALGGGGTGTQGQMRTYTGDMYGRNQALTSYQAGESI